jgi:GT2 family glycosyltransferase
VIVNHNAGCLLGDCLEAALAQAREVILVDQASNPGPFAAALSRFEPHPDLTVVRSRENTGFSAGCNRGAALATEPVLLFLNPDCILMPGSLQVLVEALVNSDRAGMVGGLLTDARGHEQGGARRSVPTPWRSFVRCFGLGRLAWLSPRIFSDFYLHRDPLPATAVEVEAVSGALTLVSREAFEDVGPWDEGFFLHCEDLDLCMRFRNKQWRVLFEPRARAIHYRGMCGRSRPLAVEWHKHRGMIRFYRKHFRDAYPPGLFSVVIAGVWLRFATVAAAVGTRIAVKRLATSPAWLRSATPRRRPASSTPSPS